jgi:hypothetical protein
MERRTALSAKSAAADVFGMAGGAFHGEPSLRVFGKFEGHYIRDLDEVGREKFLLSNERIPASGFKSALPQGFCCFILDLAGFLFAQ